MPLIDTEAIVLNAQRLGEADKLVTLLTVQRGKVRVVAKGSRRPRSRYGAALEPFTHAQIVLFEKNPAHLLRLNQASIVRSHLGIRKDLEKIEAASRMVRLTSALLPDGEANTKIFTLLTDGLARVEKGDRLEWLVWFFELQMLKRTGYQARLDDCIGCRKKLSAAYALFSPKAGGTLCGGCAGRIPEPLSSVSAGTRAMIRLMNRMDWTGLTRLQATAGMIREGLDLNSTHIEYILGKSIKPTVPLDNGRKGNPKTSTTTYKKTLNQTNL